MKIVTGTPKDFIRKGFTLVEMLVVIAIFSIITSIVLVKNSQFSDTILLNNLAYDIALSVRQAQVFGLSVRATPDSGVFTAGYGVHFDSSTPKTYVLFADINNSNIYDSGIDEIVEVFNITRGNKISRLCGVDSSDQETCGATNLDIVFIRPDPEATLTGITGDARIYIIAQDGSEESLLVRSTGQISVE